MNIIPSLNNQLANAFWLFVKKTVFSIHFWVFFFNDMKKYSLNRIAPSQKETLRRFLHVPFFLHNWKAAEGLPQLFCNRFVKLHLLLQIQTDDAVVVIDPVTMKVIHLSLQSIRHGADSFHHSLFVLWSDFTSCN